MDKMKFEQFIDNGDAVLRSVHDSGSADTAEFTALVDAFTHELSAQICGLDKQMLPEQLIGEEALRFNDKRITEIMNNVPPSEKELENSVALLERQKSQLEDFSSKGWPLPALSNTNIDVCKTKVLQSWKESEQLRKISELDRRLTDVINALQNNCNEKDCDSAEKIIYQLRQELSQCKSDGYTVPSITNNLSSAETRIAVFRREAAEKESLLQKLQEADNCLTAIESQITSGVGQWDEKIEACDTLNRLIIAFGQRNWTIPSLSNNKPLLIREKYLLYREMQRIDLEISNCQQQQLTKKDKQAFVSLCTEQNKNMAVCKQHGWRYPVLNNNDIQERLECFQKKERRHHHFKVFKRTVILIGIAIVVIAVTALVLFIRSRVGKAPMPFTSGEARNQHVAEIQSELEQAGFTNIKTQMLSSGLQKDNSVISVSMDGTKSFHKGEYLSTETPILIEFSSTGRVDLTELLQNYRTKTVDELQSELKKLGFTNLEIEKNATDSPKSNYLMNGLELNGETYYAGSCFIPLDSKIILQYNHLQIELVKEDLIEQNYKDAVNSLMEQGFTKITLKRSDSLITGWVKKEGSIKSVLVNDSEIEEHQDVWFDEEIVLIVYTFKGRGCEDITLTE